MKTDNALNHAAAAADLPSAQTVPLRIAQTTSICGCCTNG